MPSSSPLQEMERLSPRVGESSVSELAQHGETVLFSSHSEERLGVWVAPDAEAHGFRARVLLANDNADMREYLRRLLRQRYEVIAVADGEAALAAARQHKPDLVLTDVTMPRLDGFGLLQQLRADPHTSTLP